MKHRLAFQISAQLSGLCRLSHLRAPITCESRIPRSALSACAEKGGSGVAPTLAWDVHVASASRSTRSAAIPAWKSDPLVQVLARLTYRSDGGRRSVGTDEGIMLEKHQKTHILHGVIKHQWRRGGDSNPRCPCRHAAFRVRCDRPLCHLSQPAIAQAYPPC